MDKSKIKNIRQQIQSILFRESIVADDSPVDSYYDLRRIKDVRVEYLEKSRSWNEHERGFVIRVKTSGLFREASDVESEIKSKLSLIPELKIIEQRRSEKLQKGTGGYYDVRGGYHYANVESYTFSWFVELVEPITQLNEQHVEFLQQLVDYDNVNFETMIHFCRERNINFHDMIYALERNRFITRSSYRVNYIDNTMSITDNGLNALSSLNSNKE